jgi:hypothetical protein
MISLVNMTIAAQCRVTRSRLAGLPGSSQRFGMLRLGYRHARARSNCFSHKTPVWGQDRLTVTRWQMGWTVIRSNISCGRRRRAIQKPTGAC